MSAHTYIDPFSDTGFKAIFGKEGMSEEVLRQFLNEIYRGQPNFEEIQQVRFLNSERVRERPLDKTIVHDVLCTTESGTRFIVEMQKDDQQRFALRALYYVSRGITDQAVRLEGEPAWQYSLTPVAGVFITEFMVEGLPEKLLTHVGLVDLDTGKVVNHHLRMTYIQTPCFNKSAEQCETKFEKIIYTLKNMATLYAIPFKESPDDIYSRMDQLARYANLSPEEKHEYDRELKQRRDHAAELSTAYARGEAKGSGNEKRTIARNLKATGMDAATISKVTGLSEQEISTLGSEE